jgi:hypothetical protein
MTTNEALSDDVKVLARDLFGEGAGEAAEFLLCYDGREANRVRRGILKLSEGRLDRVAYYADRAMSDYRDILYWAEYPNELPPRDAVPTPG